MWKLIRKVLKWAVRRFVKFIVDSTDWVIEKLERNTEGRNKDEETKRKRQTQT